MNPARKKQFDLAVARGYHVLEDGSVVGPTGVKLKASPDKDGYRQFSLRTKNPRRSVQIHVHKFIAYLKYGDKVFEPGIVTRHLGSGAADNRPCMITIGTEADNHADKPVLTRQRVACLGANAVRLLTDDEAARVRELHGDGLGYQKIADQFGISKGAARLIIKGLTYRRKNNELYAGVSA